MSSILKALRKLEEERARRRDAPSEIATSILRGEPRRVLSPLWLWPVLIGVVILLAAGVFWGWRATMASPESKIAPLVVAEPVAAVPVKNGEVVVEEIIDPRRPVLPTVAAVRPRAVKRVHAVAAAGTSPSRVVPKRAADAPVTSELASPPRVSVPVAPAVAAVATESRPVVSAIAWQEDRAGRVAVIDGLPVMEGEQVGQATVVEIRQDRVLLSNASGPFELLLTGP